MDRLLLPKVALGQTPLSRHVPAEASGLSPDMLLQEYGAQLGELGRPVLEHAEDRRSLVELEANDECPRLVLGLETVCGSMEFGGTEPLHKLENHRVAYRNAGQKHSIEVTTVGAVSASP